LVGHGTGGDVAGCPANRAVAFDGLHGFFDHCGTISERLIERVKALNGGIAIQDRMAFPEEQIKRLESVLTVVDGRDLRRVCARRCGEVVHKATASQSATGYKSARL
jgi:predicted amidohydrolase YtcJ